MKVSIIIALLAILNNAVIAQEKPTPISGKVISFEESFPLEGASVVVKGTRNQTGTQVDGSFTLVLQQADSVIVVSYEGFASQEVKINSGKKEYDIVLRRLGNLNEFDELASGDKKLDLKKSITRRERTIDIIRQYGFEE